MDLKKALLSTLFLGALNAVALSHPAIDEGIQAYERKDWETAKAKFTQTASIPAYTFTSLYNLGNIAVRQNQLGLALAYYRKASNIYPRDRDLNFNIDFASRALHLSQHPSSYWTKITNLPRSFNRNEVLAVLFICSLLFFFQLFKFMKKRKLADLQGNEGGNWPDLFLYVTGGLFILSTTLTGMKFFDTYIERAIIIQPKVELRSGPATDNASLTEISEGSEVFVEQSSGDWKQVTIPGGLSGWVPQSTIMVISNGAQL